MGLNSAYIGLAGLCSRNGKGILERFCRFRRWAWDNRMRRATAIASATWSLLVAFPNGSSLRGTRVISICLQVSYGSRILPSTQRTPWLTRLRASRSSSWCSSSSNRLSLALRMSLSTETSSAPLSQSLMFEAICFPWWRIRTRNLLSPVDLIPRSRLRLPSSSRLRAASPRSRKSEYARTLISNICLDETCIVLYLQRIRSEPPECAFHAAADAKTNPSLSRPVPAPNTLPLFPFLAPNVWRSSAKNPPCHAETASSNQSPSYPHCASRLRRPEELGLLRPQGTPVAPFA